MSGDIFLKTLPAQSGSHGAYREQQRPTPAGPVPEPASQGARSGVDLPGQWHQAAGPDRVLRPVRGPAARHGYADGLQERDLHCRARPRGELQSG